MTFTRELLERALALLQDPPERDPKPFFVVSPYMEKDARDQYGSSVRIIVSKTISTTGDLND